MPRTRTLLAIVLLPILVFLVACGGDDDDSGSSSSDQPSASSSSGGSTSSSSDSSSGSSSSSSSSSESSSSDPSGEEILANCPELLGMFGAFSAGAFANPGAGNVGDDLETLADVLQNAADNAPSEIKDDMQVVANTFATFYSKLDDLGVDFSNPASFASLSASQQAEFQAAMESLDTAEFEQASNNLTAYFDENCSS
jgi:hypothetical protein